MNRRQRLVIVGAVTATVIVACATWVYSLGPASRGTNLEYSHTVLDREGRLLRAYATPEGRWRLPATEQDVDPRFLRLLLAYEDKRFRSHHGVDPQSLGVAACAIDRPGQVAPEVKTSAPSVSVAVSPA